MTFIALEIGRGKDVRAFLLPTPIILSEWFRYTYNRRYRQSNSFSDVFCYVVGEWVAPLPFLF